MTVNETPISDDAQAAATPLELLTDEEDVWTAVPADATGDERVTKWLSVDVDTLCDLEEWQ
ncbi:hypothetical protein [Haloterrigena salinisoli]|uniref:DUF7511 domain-containing protein n=1 Tax=Haloterrigena salinisoli TaxID=3132747 RepID=UPI0030D452C2